MSDSKENDMPHLKCLDFSAMGFPTGMLVRRSEHYLKDRCIKARSQVGIVTEFKVYQNDDQQPVVWPVVAWEGVTTGPASTNPALVDVHRAKDKKRAVYVELYV